MSDIQNADPRLRRRTISLLFALAATVAIALPLVPTLNLQAAKPAWANVRASQLWAAVATVLVLSAAGMGAQISALGRAIRRTGQFPLPGQRVMRDTVILTGDAACNRGRILQGLGGAICLVACGLALVAWRIYEALQANGC
jgi:hypothetical protein